MNPAVSEKPASTLREMASEAMKQFADRFGRPARWVVAAPGRVNLIGEHTDYNGGFVLPMAIERYVVIAADHPRGGGPADLRRVTLQTTMSDAHAVFDLNASLTRGQPAWSNYIRGPLSGCLSRGLDPGGFDALIHSNIPVGGGCSSSAALEVAVTTLVECITGRQLDPMDKIRLCQTAEHTFAGVPCGIMDMAISQLGRADDLLLLDCRSNEYEYVPLTEPRVTILVANTNVKHELSDGGYAKRRAECFAAAAVLGVPDLRSASMPQLIAARNKMDPIVFRRAHHVIGEIQRTLDAVAALKRGDWRSVGELMYASHASLRDDFEVSCIELDTMVEFAAAIGPAGGVVGSRMTGGGYGGCTVSLVATESVASIAAALHDGYLKKTGLSPAIFTSRPAAGAHVIDSQHL